MSHVSHEMDENGPAFTGVFSVKILSCLFMQLSRLMQLSRFGGLITYAISA
jgi:hypothetical protein